MIVAASVVPLLATPSFGQSLTERLAEVRRRQAREAASRAQPATTVQMLQSLFYTNLTVDLDATPARDVFTYLQTTLNQTVLVRYLDDTKSFGIDPETPITLSVKNLAAIDVLDLVLEQCSIPDPCTWQLRNGFIEVGPKERLGVPSARVRKVYPIDDLLSEVPQYDDGPVVGLGPRGYDGIRTSDYYAPRYPSGRTGSFGPTVNPTPYLSREEQKRRRADEVIGMIIETIEPAAWVRNGGESATIRFHDDALVVNAPDYIQRQIGGYPTVPRPRAARPRPDRDERPAPVTPPPASP